MRSTRLVSSLPMRSTQPDSTLPARSPRAALTESSVVRLVGLKPEAWAMATVTHPGVAQIHGVEFWRGRPFLIVEFLAGGTLEDRLQDGQPLELSVAPTTAPMIP